MAPATHGHVAEGSSEGGWLSILRSGVLGRREWGTVLCRACIFDATPRVVNDPVGRVRRALHEA